MRQLVSQLAQGTKVIPVLVIEKVSDAVPLAKCLVENGLPVLEITLRTPAAIEAVELISQEVEDCIVGVGSVANKEHLDIAQSAGADFGVSPGVSPELLEALRKSSLPFLPGAATISEILTLRDAGFFQQKLFPAGVLGGPEFLKAVGGPVQDVSFCPTGGITLTTASDYLRLKNVFAIGGTWIASTDLVAEHNWNEIARRAREAANLSCNELE